MRITRRSHRSSGRVCEDRNGAILVLIALTLPVILIFVAFGVDLAYMQLVRMELRVATDAAARAGGRRLSMSQNVATARTEAIAAAARNTVAGDPLLLADSDVTFGKSILIDGSERSQFVVDNEETNAIRVFGSRRSDSRSGAVSLFFGRVVGNATFEPTMTAVTTQIDRDIALVLDRSGSMAAADDESTAGRWRRPKNAPRRWAWGKRVPSEARWLDLEFAVEGFFEELARTPQEEEVALATFATEATLDQRLTSNRQLVLDKVHEITEEFDGGATNVGQGMSEAITALTEDARPFAARTIVVMTDGVWNRGSNPIETARQAADRGITIHAVTFSEEADQDTMRTVAEIGGGQFWHAPDGATLLHVFRAIAANSPTLLTE